jgi:hypothetical protein
LLKIVIDVDTNILFGFVVDVEDNSDLGVGVIEV